MWGANYLDVCDHATGPETVQAAKVAAGIRSVIRAEKDRFSLEYPCHSPTERRWFLIRATRFEGVGPIRVVVSHENITATKLADEDRERFAALVQNSNDFIGMSTLSGEMIYANPAGDELLGLDPERRGAAMKITDYFTEEGLPAVKETSLPILMATGRWKGELQFKNFQTGQPIEMDSSTFIVRDPNGGEPLCLAIIARDVTERKKQEEELHRARAQLMDAIESLDAGLVMYGPDERLVVCNMQYRQMYAACAHAMVPGTLYADILRVFSESGVPDLAGESPREWVVRRLAAHRHPGKPVAQRLAGRWIQISDHRTSDGGVVSLRTDITALKEAQEAADAANRAKSEFLANMSHEIRTPMNGIIGLTGLALDTELAPEQREYLDGVLLSAESLLKIINSILDFSKIEAGKMELEQIVFDLSAVVGNTIKTLALRAHEKHLELLLEICPDVPRTLIGDAARLRQIVINLIGNALKFTKQGEILVLVELEKLLDQTAVLRFTVSDTGIGIPANQQDKLFRPFMQADNSTTRIYGGTGLGLVISARLVEMMGGRTWLESELGHGSHFHFTAQFGLQTNPSTSEISRQAVDVAGVRVLIVDDNATNRRIQMNQLASWGMRPDQVDGGRAALKALHAAIGDHDPFNLILLDVVMPEMDGFEVLERIRAMPEIHRPTILMLSSADRRGDLKRARELGTAAYLQKPIDPQELFAAIVTALGLVSQQTTNLHTAARVAAATPPGRRLHILLAEDNPVNQLLAVRTLEKAGHTVVVANNGQEALTAAGRETFDLVLMDVQMPVMDGFQATAQIRQRERETGRHLPIVAMTAHAIKGDRERCLDAGMDGYVAKPIRKSELFAAIAAAAVDKGQSPAPTDECLVQTAIPAPIAEPVKVPETEPANPQLGHTADGKQAKSAPPSGAEKI